MELQTGSEAEIDVRVLQYHVGLLARHQKPVITVIMYPFETTIPQPPYREMSGTDVLLALYYRVLALWTLDAHNFVREEAICLYTLLPAMQGANAAMLIQALHDMKAYYTHQQFGNHLVRFKRIVERSTTLSEQDKRRVEEEIRMHMAYDWFIDDNPDVQERVAKGEERGLQRSALKIVKTRFPALVELAQTRIVLIDNQEKLDHLIDQLLVLTDEASVRQLLT